MARPPLVSATLARWRLHNMNWAKLDIARQANHSDMKGTLEGALQGADVYIGLSSSLI
jgi:hypothetical protein